MSQEEELEDGEQISVLKALGFSVRLLDVRLLLVGVL